MRRNVEDDVCCINRFDHHGSVCRAHDLQRFWPQRLLSVAQFIYPFNGEQLLSAYLAL